MELSISEDQFITMLINLLERSINTHPDLPIQFKFKVINNTEKVNEFNFYTTCITSNIIRIIRGPQISRAFTTWQEFNFSDIVISKIIDDIIKQLTGPYAPGYLENLKNLMGE